jgi:AraC-like DNA-binding protein
LSAPGRLDYLSESDNQERVLAQLMEQENPEALEAWGNVVNEEAAKTHLAAINEAVGSIESLRRHLVRSSRSLTRQYCQESGHLLRFFRKNPTNLLETIVVRQAAAAKRILKATQQGNLDESVVRVTLQTLWEETNQHKLKQEKPKAFSKASSVAKAGERDEDPWDHAAFIKAFSRECGVKPLEWRGLSNGVYLTLGAADCDKMAREFQGVTDWVTRITDKLGYVLVKRGLKPSPDGVLGSNEWLFLKNDDFNKKEQDDHEKTTTDDTGSKLRNRTVANINEALSRPI